MAVLLVFAALGFGGYKLSLMAAQARERMPPQAEILPALAKEGQAVYARRCTACHGIDPSKAGTHGPDIQSSSLELLTAKVLRGEYPEGYAPKWNTMAMRRLPLTEGDMEAIHAFFRYRDGKLQAEKVEK
jgi:mono/diheme cytochrome c family protein